MSIFVTSHAWKYSQSSGSTLLVMLAICDFADDKGYAFPSVSTLAKKSRSSDRTVRYALKELTAFGELSIEPNAGPRGCNVYKVELQNLKGAKTAPIKNSPKGAAMGCRAAYFAPLQNTTEPLQNTTVPLQSSVCTPATHCSQTIIEPPIEPSIEPSISLSACAKPKKIGFDLTTGKFTNLSAQNAMDWKTAFPNLNLDAEVNRAACWIIANPAKRPTSNFARFLVSWLSRAQKDFDHASIRQPSRSYYDAQKAFSDELTGRNRRAQDPIQLTDCEVFNG